MYKVIRNWKWNCRSVVFGVAGFIFGHELVHAFDNVGRKFDLQGNAKDWWSEEASEQFDQKANCFIEQFSNFCLSELQQEPRCVNGRLTLQENIADSGGLRAALKAYQKWLISHNEQKLPGLSHLSDLQSFFLATASRSCAKRRLESLAWQVREDPHTPNNFRMNGLMRNMEEFARAFNCKPGSFMNPVQKCKVWWCTRLTCVLLRVSQTSSELLPF